MLQPVREKGRGVGRAGARRVAGPAHAGEGKRRVRSRARAGGAMASQCVEDGEEGVDRSVG
jgi:hypothetical protein